MKMTNKSWVAKEKAPQKFIKQFPDYPGFFASLLWQRGLKTKKEIDSFLYPDYEKDPHDPLLLTDMKKASDRIWQAIERKEKVMVFGDYDADGICSSAILGEFFRELEFEHGVYMPDRRTEGHGLNMGAIEAFIKNGVNLLITLDCGVTNIKEIELAQKNGMDVIVVDHHQVLDDKPPAYALVDQHQQGDKYPFKGLCGAGLAFKLFQVLAKDKRAKGRWDEGKEKWLLDLFALGTVADMMPLLDENRTLVKYGLLVLAQTKRLGLQELFKVAHIEPVFDRKSMQTTIDAITIGFSLGPQINAASRMAHAALGYDLVMSEDVVKARGLALELEANNTKRKKEIDHVFKEVISQIDCNGYNFIVESSPNWPITILGLIANKVKDKCPRPTMLINEQGEESKASLRAPAGFDLIKALDSAKDLMIQYGGHKAAAGGSLQTKNIPALKKHLDEYAKEHLTEEMKTSKVDINEEIKLKDITIENIRLIEKLDPFGMANPQPNFLISDVELVELKIMGKKNQHAKLFFSSGEIKKIPALLFFHDGEVENLEIGQHYDIVGGLSINEWNGRHEPQLKIIDIKKHG